MDGWYTASLRYWDPGSDSGGRSVSELRALRDEDPLAQATRFELAQALFEAARASSAKQSVDGQQLRVWIGLYPPSEAGCATGGILGLEHGAPAEVDVG